jgi:hypothetical protein
MRLFLGFVGALALAGCTSNTGILPAGPDTYTLTTRAAPILGGSDAAQGTALNEANEFCQAKGMVFVPNNMAPQAGITTPRPTGYSVTFRCLLPTDPAVASYRLQQAPNIIVEQRNR